MNNSFKLRMFSILWLLLLFSSISAQYNSVIKGRVVDDKGKPIKALLTFDMSDETKDKDCGGDSMGVMSGADGKFSIREDCTEPVRSIRLFVAPEPPENAITLLYPSTSDLPRRESRFAGMPVFIEKNNNVDLGDVPIQFSFGTIELTVLDKNDKPYFKNIKDWSKIILALRDKDGNFINAQEIAIVELKQSFNQEKGSLRLTIPEGEWIIELITDWKDLDPHTNETKHSLASTNLIVNKSDSFKSICVKVK